jgi:hypothetical protein
MPRGHCCFMPDVLGRGTATFSMWYMRGRKSLAAVGLIFVLATVILLMRQRGPFPARPPISITLLPSTNAPNGSRLFACVMSNQCQRSIKLWSVIYGERAPFLINIGPNQWGIIGGRKDRYLRPGETEYLTFPPPALAGKWRLMIPWSEGYRARLTAFAARYKFLPIGFRVAPEHYVASEVLLE